MTSIFVASSASRNLLYWNEPIGWPNALRSFDVLQGLVEDLRGLGDVAYGVGEPLLQ